MRENDVRFGDAADAAAQNLRANFVIADSFKCSLDRFDRTLHIRFDDKRQQALFAFLAALEQLIHREACNGRLP